MNYQHNCVSSKGLERGNWFPEKPLDPPEIDNWAVGNFNLQMINEYIAVSFGLQVNNLTYYFT